MPPNPKRAGLMQTISSPNGKDAPGDKAAPFANTAPSVDSRVTRIGRGMRNHKAIAAAAPARTNRRNPLVRGLDPARAAITD